MFNIYVHAILSEYYFILVLTVEFTSGQFTGSELSESIEVEVRITGGTSTTPITVTVTPTEQSPVSAVGKSSYVCIYS